MSTFVEALRGSLTRLALATWLAAALLGTAACTSPPAEGPASAGADQAAQEQAASGDDGAAQAEEPAEMATLGDAAHGEELFIACASCHGMDARGVEGLGKDLHDNAFIADMSDDEVVAFLKTGRSASHELNTTGVDMPPKGGNPALSDEDLYDIVAYMRSLE